MLLLSNDNNDFPAGGYGIIFSAHGDPPPDPNLPTPHGTLLEGTVFSLFAGLVLGATLGAVIPWLTDQFLFFWLGVSLGAFTGAGVGWLLGAAYRARWSKSTRAHLGTVLGVTYGIIPSLLLVALGTRELRGLNSGYVLMGCLFAGPMVGLILGGILDRAFEEWQRNHRRLARRFGLTAMAVALLSIGFFDWLAQGPAPEALGNRVKQMLVSHWQERYGRHLTNFRPIELKRKGRMEYEGEADALVDGKSIHLTLEILLEDGTIKLSWKQAGDQDVKLPPAPPERAFMQRNLP
jgi:MFS family permease